MDHGWTWYSGPRLETVQLQGGTTVDRNDQFALSAWDSLLSITVQLGPQTATSIRGEDKTYSGDVVSCGALFTLAEPQQVQAPKLGFLCSPW